MGPVLWRDDNSGGAAEIMDDAQRFDALKIPGHCLVCRSTLQRWCTPMVKMNFGEGFENPEKWIAKLKEAHGVEFMTWTATAFFGDARFKSPSG